MTDVLSADSDKIEIEEPFFGEADVYIREAELTCADASTLFEARSLLRKALLPHNINSHFLFVGGSRETSHGPLRLVEPGEPLHDTDSATTNVARYGEIPEGFTRAVIFRELTTMSGVSDFRQKVFPSGWEVTCGELPMYPGLVISSYEIETEDISEWHVRIETLPDIEALFDDRHLSAA